MSAPRVFIAVLVSAGLGLFLAGCSVVQKGADILTSQGKMSSKDRDAIVKTSEAVRSTFSDISEEEEYFIGRSVAAMILSKYPAYKNDNLTQYINLVGNAVAVYSDRPEIYAGWHFLVLDTEEVNALAAPGGMIFITKGLLRRCRDEESLGLILSHEVGHVCAKHGLQSIKKSRLVDAFRLIGQQAAQRYSPENLAQLTNIFENVLGDIAEQLIERGYDRKYEYEADRLAVKFGVKTGFDPSGITRFLQTMVGDSSSASGKGWFKTHPTPEDRIASLEKEMASLGPLPKIEAVRTERFRQYMNSLK
jgi:predicted Zn-dependent protease